MPVDIVKALRELYQEKRHLDLAIAKLEAKQRADRDTNQGEKQRGRKSMSPEERRAVSQRMADYWAARKGSNGSGPESSSIDVSENVRESVLEEGQATA
jgi:hypothetical protein